MADVPHTALVRATHWINSTAFLALVVSGGAILIAHPRLYWGETGSIGTPSLIDLPIPMILGHSGWGRYLHFLAAWVAVLNGVVYMFSALRSRHFDNYNPLQRAAYSVVVFVLFPLVILTGLAMSPAITAVFPALVAILGGHQSARTIHFFTASALVIFFLGHVAMVVLSGFTTQMRGMIVGVKA